MAIISSLKSKGLKVVDGTTLIAEQTPATTKNKDWRRSAAHLISTETKDELGKWAKTRVNPEDYKKLKKLAIDKNVSLAELFRGALRILLREEGGEIGSIRNVKN